MKAIILAAGLGRRLDMPQQHKSLLPLPLAKKTVPLIVYTIEALQEQDIRDITIITGYLHQQIEEAVSEYRVKCCYNPFFYLVNSIGSLWFARNEIDDDTLLLNADTFVEKRLYSEFLSATLPDYPLLLVDSSRKEVADVRVRFHDGFLTGYGKELKEPLAESTDIILLPRAHTQYFRNQLEQLIEERQHDTWWENALVDNTDLLPVKIWDVAGYFWSEVDYYRDYQRICDFITQQSKAT